MTLGSKWLPITLASALWTATLAAELGGVYRWNGDYSVEPYKPQFPPMLLALDRN